jgi:hypothetical protein
MSAVFLTSPNADGDLVAGGTAFLVTLKTIQKHHYLVTAKHNVEHRDDISVRLGRQGAVTLVNQGQYGFTQDVPLDEEGWTHHPNADVSLRPFEHFLAGLSHAFIPIENAVPEPEDHHVMLGQDIFFIGLVPKIPAMSENNIPMVRSGTIGLMNQRGIEIEDERTKIRSKIPSAHLIDCRAYKGMSGAPCFAQYFDVRIPADEAEPPHLVTRTYLFGLISGHFDVVEKDKGTGSAYPIHTGIGVVTPVRSIRELLMEDETLKKDRDEKDRKKREEDSEELVATADSAMEPEGLDETGKLLGDLFQVPKSEADEVHRGHQS